MKEKIAQEILKNAGLYSGAIDGIFGRNSIKAARGYSRFPEEWNGQRLAVAVIQTDCLKRGIKEVGIVDGLWGVNTQTAYNQLLIKMGKKEQPPKVSQDVILKTRYNDWPSQNYHELVKFYGEVGANQTSLPLPYEMVLAWDTDVKINKITCHEKVADSLGRIFKNTLDHYGLDVVKQLRLNYFGGCLNVRKMRGGSSWSMHSWGIAVDLDPDRNRLRWGRDKAIFAQPEYEPFWKIVESEGWTSLGRKRNYDWMHVQAADL